MRLLVFVLLSSLCAAQDLKRPTADANGGNNLNLGCSGQNAASSSMPLAYDSAGQSTSSSTSITGSKTQTFFSTRIFSSWQTTTNVYSSLTLNVNWSGTETTSGSIGNMCVAYSVNGGTTYTVMNCTGGGNENQGTNTVNLSASQNLSTVKVGICTQGGAGGDSLGSTDKITVYDIWTVGIISGGQGAGPGSTAGQPHRDIVIVN